MLSNCPARFRAVEQGELKAGVHQLLGELKSYQWEDGSLVQDSVISLAIALHGAEQPRGSITIL